MPRDRMQPWYQFLPAMTDDEFLALKQSIADHGFRAECPVIMTTDGRILDGHHRARACVELGIEPPTVVVDIAEDDRWDYVFDANVTRRHLTAAQRREMAEQYVARHPAAPTAEVAEKSGVSEMTARTIRRELGAPMRRPPTLSDKLSEATDPYAIPGQPITVDVCATPETPVARDLADYGYQPAVADAWRELFAAGRRVRELPVEDLQHASASFLSLSLQEHEWQAIGEHVREVFRLIRLEHWQAGLDSVA
jgi:hypothetical protein